MKNIKIELAEEIKEFAEQLGLSQILTDINDEEIIEWIREIEEEKEKV